MVRGKLVFLFCLLLFCCSLHVLGQQAVLSGLISDSHHVPLPAVAIYIKGTSTGTSTNTEGLYRLKLNPGRYTLSFSLVGSQTATRTINLPPGATQLDLLLAENAYSLAEVTVRATREDPARRIMRNAIARRNYYYSQVAAYKCQVYIRGIQKLRNAPKSFLGADVRGQLQSLGLDSGKRGILYLSESVTRLSAKKPDQVHEEMISSRVSGDNNSFSFNQATDLMVDFYQNRVDLKALTPRQYISPLADYGFSVYRYKLLGIAENAGHKLYRIQVTPRRNSDNLFAGLLYIRDQSWNIESLDLQLTGASKVELLDTLQIRQQFIEPRPGVFVLSTVEYRFSWNIFKFSGFGNYLETLTDYDLEPIFTRRDFPSDILHIARTANKRDSSYWNQIRSTPLTKEEAADYIRKDSILIAHSSRRYQDSVDHKHNHIGPASLLVGQVFKDHFNKSSIVIAPLVAIFSYNTVEGLAFSPQATYTRNTADTTSYTLGANLRYGFVNCRFNPSASYSQTFNTLTNSIFSFSGGSVIKDQNRLGGIDPLYNTVQTLFEKINPLKLYEKHFVRLDYGQDLTRQVNLSLGLEFANRIPLRNSAFDYIHGRPYQHFSANDPFSPPGNALAFTRNQTFTLHFAAKINFGEKFISRPDLLIPQGSEYPTLYLNYRKGIPGVLGTDADYNFVSGRLTQNNIETDGMGRFNYSVSGGSFITHKNLTYLDYQHFTASSSTLFERGEAFEIINSYRYSASRYFLHTHIEENFMGDLFSKIPLVRQLKLNEILGASYMTNDQLHNYLEIYAGIQRFGLRASYTYGFIDGKRHINGLTLNIGGF